jgi:rod shape determining protein RodA
MTLLERVRTARPALVAGQRNRPGLADPALVLSAASLGLIGVVLVWSATATKLSAAGASPTTTMSRQAMNLGMGIVLCLVVSQLGYRRLRAYTPVLYAASLVGLIAVLSPLGSTINGAHAWIRLPAGFTLQPSEFAKVAVIVGMSLVLNERTARDSVPVARDVGRALALAAVPTVLVLLQPDLGTVMVMAAIVAGMLVVAGTQWRMLFALAGLAALGVAAAVAVGLFDEYQIHRLVAFTNPEAGALTYGYNTQQARIAIGAGGLIGRGLFRGWQTQGGFVPFNQTDFVISVAGEELGLLGLLVILALLGVVLWRGLTIALNARDLFSRLIACGVVVWLAVQSFENIGMNLGIMPVTGVPMPFVSYGGSSMFAAWIGIGLLLNVDRASRA